MLGKFEELLIILLIILVLFGGKQVPKLARGIGESVRELKRSVSGTDSASNEEAVKTSSAASKSKGARKVN